MRYLEISPSIGRHEHSSHSSKSKQQPSWKNYGKSNLVGASLLVRDRLLRIYEIVSVLGYADTLEIFADRFLDLGLKSVEWFLAGHAGTLNPNTVDYLQSKLVMCAIRWQAKLQMLPILTSSEVQNPDIIWYYWRLNIWMNSEKT